jgi:hypothetical protein
VLGSTGECGVEGLVLLEHALPEGGERRVLENSRREKRQRRGSCEQLGRLPRCTVGRRPTVRGRGRAVGRGTENESPPGVYGGKRRAGIGPTYRGRDEQRWGSGYALVEEMRKPIS